MANFIQIDYDTAIKCANELKAQADYIMRYREKETAFINASKTYWKGNSGDEIREGMTESKKRMKQIADELDGLANDIISVANQLKNKDEDLSKAMNLLDRLKDMFD